MNPIALTRWTTRRRLLAAAALAGPGFVVAASELTRSQQGTPIAPSTPGAGAAAEAVGASVFAMVMPPDWVFTVHDFQDPFIGTVDFPEEQDPALRYIAADIQIDNASNQALPFSTGDIRLRDESGIEYRTGGFAGTAPSLDSRTLNPGERARGWIWFAVPADAEIVQLVFIGPEPEFRVALMER